MGQLMTLSEAINSWREQDEEAIIYAVRPWTKDSVALVAVDPEDGGDPDEALAISADYFLEIAVVSEFLEGWLDSRDGLATTDLICERVIQYAVNDA